jgi:hypothetical protein
MVVVLFIVRFLFYTLCVIFLFAALLVLILGTFGIFLLELKEIYGVKLPVFKKTRKVIQKIMDKIDSFC